MSTTIMAIRIYWLVILMNEFLALSFVQRGLTGAVLIGAICSLIGVFVILRGMSYIGSGIAHGCLAGVALAFLIGANPLLLSMLAALTMVFLIELINRKTQLKMDASIGVIFSLAMAMAILFIGLQKKYTPDLMSYLFGNLLRISVQELWVMAGIGTLILLIVILIYKELQYATFDPEMADLSGIPTALLSTILSILMGLTIVVSLQAVGELLVLALIVLPASIALQYTTSLKKMIVISVSVGILASIFGLTTAFYLDAPTGSTIVIMLGLMFFASMLATWFFKLLHRSPTKIQH